MRKLSPYLIFIGMAGMIFGTCAIENDMVFGLILFAIGALIAVPVVIKARMEGWDAEV